jgi:hypothetical protein
MRGRYAPIVQVCGDLPERPTGFALVSDAVDDFRRQRLRPPALVWRSRRASCLPPLRDEPLNLVDGNESRSPWHLDCLDQRKDTAIERRAAHAEGRGRLSARVDQPLDARRLSDNVDRCCGRIGNRVAADLLASAPPSTVRHLYSVHK